MSSVLEDQLAAYRAETYRSSADRRIARRDDAVRFVAERGFAYLWPIRDVTMPSLWVAVAGDRPVPDEHDDAGHITWRWKDELLGSRLWYYAKVLRRKATFISPELLPSFYALSENFGDIEADTREMYRTGRLSREARTLVETLLEHGQLDTVSLRRLARMTSRAADSAYNRAMEQLQADFKIVPVGVAEAGAWRYAFIYDITTRFYPELGERARLIRQTAARETLLRCYLGSVGAATPREIGLLFRWSGDQVREASAPLCSSGEAVEDARLAGGRDPCLALRELVA
jgi:hypothetical protein